MPCTHNAFNSSRINAFKPSRHAEPYLPAMRKIPPAIHAFKPSRHAKSYLIPTDRTLITKDFTVNGGGNKHRAGLCAVGRTDIPFLLHNVHKP